MQACIISCNLHSSPGGRHHQSCAFHLRQPSLKVTHGWEAQEAEMGPSYPKLMPFYHQLHILSTVRDPLPWQQFPGELCLCGSVNDRVNTNTRNELWGVFRNLETYYLSSVQLLRGVRLFVTPWIAVRQASLSITNSIPKYTRQGRYPLKKISLIWVTDIQIIRMVLLCR